MNDLLGNPAVQAGIVPFAAALAVGLPLRNTRTLVLAIGAALLAVVWLTMGLAFEPLTSVRKLVVAGFGAVVLALALEAAPPRHPLVRSVLLAGSAAAVAVWVVLGLLRQKELVPALLAGSGAALYLAVLVYGMHRTTATSPLRSTAVSLMLGLGTGGLALLGASAQLAQIGIAIGAAAGAVLLALLLGRGSTPTWTLGMPAMVVTGLAGLLAVFTGVLPWFCLLPVLAAPWAARVVPDARDWPGLLTACCTAAAAALPMLLAVTLAWVTAGAST